MRLRGTATRRLPLHLESAVDFPLLAFLAGTLIVRVLTDHLSSANSRQTGSLNLSGVIALVLILVAFGLILRRRRGIVPTILAVLFVGVWTAVAVSTRGASAETLREGVREASIIAVGVIVYNGARAVNMRAATRIVQIAGFVPAILALYQVVTDTGLDVDHNIRSNGTFSHPNGAAMFFATAAVASLWRYHDDARRRLSDLLLLILFAASLVTTFSIDGLVVLVVMLTTFGVLCPETGRVKLLPYAIAVIACLAFFATPLGAQRVANESSTRLAAVQGAEPNTSLAWRLKKWNLLLHTWKRYPLVGQGLGTTVTERAIAGNKFAGDPPHNEYVRYLVETGVVGLIALIASLLILIRTLIRHRSFVPRLHASCLSLAIVVVLGFLVDALADNTFLYTPASYAAVLIIASALSIPRSPETEMVRAA